jgi:HlyD family secretion protein
MRVRISLPHLAASLAFAVLLAGCGAGRRTSENRTAAPATAPADSSPKVLFACQGRVEGRSETIEVGAATDGVVTAVHVKEGRQVRRGDLLAEIGCEDLKASLLEAQATVESARQVKVRLVRGSRQEERLASEQRTAQARAVVKQAVSELARRKRLIERDDISRSDYEQAERDRDVAEARLNEALRNEELVKAPALSEEIAKADADIRAAERRTTAISEKIAKCRVYSPISGTVLRVLLKQGESFSTAAPRPLAHIADLTLARVRAEVDERDVARVKVGQKVRVFQEGFREQAVAGVVENIYRTMGRKRVASGDPAEKTDRDILETMILLDEQAPRLPLGLRVIVQFAE